MASVKNRTRVKISKDYAREVAKNLIQRYDDIREETVLKLVNSRMEIDQRNFLEKFFGKPKRFMTREDALTDIKKRIDGWYPSEYDWIMIRGESYYQAAEDLLAVSNNPNINDTIEIDVTLLNSLT